MISIIICTINRLKQIQDCLNALSIQTVKDFEVIIVDGREDDLLNSMLKKYQLFHIKHIKINKQNLPYARNIGANYAKFSLLCFLDDDTIPANNLVEEIGKHFQTFPDTTLLGGKITAKDSDLLSSFLERFSYQGKKLCQLFMIPGVVMVLNRKKIIRKKIFDEQMVTAGDDTELCFFIDKSKGIIYYNPLICVQHQFRSNLFAFMRRQQDYAEGDFAVTLKYPDQFFVYPYLGDFIYFTKNKLALRKKMLFLPVIQPLIILKKVIKFCHSHGMKYLFISFIRECAYITGLWLTLLRYLEKNYSEKSTSF